jgi:hypothetical protein
LTYLQPDPKYTKGQYVWLTDEEADEEDGSCRVQINADAKWNNDAQQFTYQLKLGDGTLHKDGAFIAEKWLNRKQKV